MALKGIHERPEASVPDLFVTPAEELDLVDLAAGLDMHHVVIRDQPSKRLVRHFGSGYDYRSRKVVEGEPLPAELDAVRRRAEEFAGLEDGSFVEALITFYPVGAGISWHRDAPAFGDRIVGVSLGAPCRLQLRRDPSGRAAGVRADPRAALRVPPRRSRAQRVAAPHRADEGRPLLHHVPHAAARLRGVRMADPKVDIRARQAPLRQRYTDDPAARRARSRVRGGSLRPGDPLHVAITPDSVPGVEFRVRRPPRGGRGRRRSVLGRPAARGARRLPGGHAAHGGREHGHRPRGTRGHGRGRLGPARHARHGARVPGRTDRRSAPTRGWWCAGDERGERAERLLRSAERYCVILDTLRRGRAGRVDHRAREQLTRGAARRLAVEARTRTPRPSRISIRARTASIRGGSHGFAARRLGGHEAGHPGRPRASCSRRTGWTA